MKKIILEKDLLNNKTSRGILNVIRGHRKKLSIGLGCITIVSGMLLSSGCSINNENDDFKTEITTAVETISDVEEFDSNKCEIEKEHTHLCAWEETSDQGEILVKMQQWCKCEEIEELRIKHFNSNFKVTESYSIIDPDETRTIIKSTLQEEQLEKFDPNKCEIKGEHYHKCTYVITIKYLDGTTEYEHIVQYCKDEDIEKLRSKYQNHDFKITEAYYQKIVSTPVANKTLTKKVS